MTEQLPNPGQIAIEAAPGADPKTQLLAANKWDQGLVWFGFPASETSVKVKSSLELLKTQDNFPQEMKDFEHVTLTFDSKRLKNPGKNKAGMGVASADWATLSDGKSYMPAICENGTMKTESGEIVKMFAERFPDTSLSADEQAEVMKWIDFNNAGAEPLLEALKHWGWCSMNGKKPNYKAFGKGNKDLAWEKETVKKVHTFLSTMDAHFAEKADKTYFVGNKLTLADCLLLNWTWSFKHVLRMKVSKRYPNLWANAVALKKTKPAGTKDFYGVFPIFGNVVAMLSCSARGCCCCGPAFSIENPKYWD